MKILKILAAVGAGLLLLWLYPVFVDVSTYFQTLAGSVHTLTTLESLFFMALPLLILVLIIYFITRALKGNWNIKW